MSLISLTFQIHICELWELREMHFFLFTAQFLRTNWALVVQDGDKQHPAVNLDFSYSAGGRCSKVRL